MSQIVEKMPHLTMLMNRSKRSWIRIEKQMTCET